MTLAIEIFAAALFLGIGLVGVVIGLMPTSAESEWSERDEQVTRGAMSRTTTEAAPVDGARAFVLADLDELFATWPAGRDKNKGAA